MDSGEKYRLTHFENNLEVIFDLFINYDFKIEIHFLMKTSQGLEN
jgi:hypothetical protein